LKKVQKKNIETLLTGPRGRPLGKIFFLSRTTPGTEKEGPPDRATYFPPMLSSRRSKRGGPSGGGGGKTLGVVKYFDK